MLDFGIPAGDKGDKGDAGVQGQAGAPGLSNYGQVTAVATGHLIIKSNNGRIATVATAHCPPGEKVLSGGYVIGATVNGAPARQIAAVGAVKLNSSKSNIYRNRPTSDGNGWTVAAVTYVEGGKNNGARVTLNVTANCAKAS